MCLWPTRLWAVKIGFRAKTEENTGLEEGARGRHGRQQGRRKGRGESSLLSWETVTQVILISLHSTPIRTEVWYSKTKTRRRLCVNHWKISIRWPSRKRSGKMSSKYHPYPRPPGPWPVLRDTAFAWEFAPDISYLLDQFADWTSLHAHTHTHTLVRKNRFLESKSDFISCICFWSFRMGSSWVWLSNMNLHASKDLSLNILVACLTSRPETFAFGYLLRIKPELILLHLPGCGSSIKHGAYSMRYSECYQKTLLAK